MNKKGINFNVLHEFIHYLFHSNDENYTFTEDRDTLKYSFTDQLPEFQVNIGASAILIPNPVLIQEFKNETNSYLISDKYEISESTLYRRLVQLMQGDFEASHHATSTTASKIMSGRFKNSALTLAKNLETKTLYANPFMKLFIYKLLENIIWRDLSEFFYGEKI